MSTQGSYYDVFAPACSDLSDLYKSRSAGFTSGIGMACDAGGFRSAFLICRICLDGDILYDDNISADKPADDQKDPY